MISTRLSGAMLLMLASACTSELELELDGKQCQGEGRRCVTGYVCDTARNLCVRPDELNGGGGVDGLLGGAGGTPANGGSGGAAGGSGAGAGTSGAGGAPGSGGMSPEAGTGGSVLGDASVDAAADACTPIELYRDEDGDGIGVTANRRLGCPAPGWVSQPGDCRDDERRVFLGQEEYFGEPYPDPTKTQAGEVSFDFDCSGSEQPDPSNDPSTPAPATCATLSCAGTGYLPAAPARSGAGIEPRCGSNVRRTCVTPQGLLTCEAQEVSLSDDFRFRCR